MTYIYQVYASLYAPERRSIARKSDTTDDTADESADRLVVTYQLCELLDIMMDVAPLRQNTLIVLAVSADLVPRLWYSALKVRASAASCDAGAPFKRGCLYRASNPASVRQYLGFSKLAPSDIDMLATRMRRQS